MRGEIRGGSIVALANFTGLCRGGMIGAPRNPRFPVLPPLPVPQYSSFRVQGHARPLNGCHMPLSPSPRTSEVCFKPSGSSREAFQPPEQGRHDALIMVGWLGPSPQYIFPVAAAIPFSSPPRSGRAVLQAGLSMRPRCSFHIRPTTAAFICRSELLHAAVLDTINGL